MSRTAQFWGAGSVDALFPNKVPLTSAPWPQASPSKTHRTFNPRLVDEALQDPESHRQPVDPRNLYASQPSVTRAGVSHYMSGSEELYADSHQAGNQHPVVFRDTVRGRDVLLSGHHRATVSLLRGEQFSPVVVEGEPATHRDAVEYQREQMKRQRAALGYAN